MFVCCGYFSVYLQFYAHKTVNSQHCIDKWPKQFDRKATSPPHINGSIVFANRQVAPTCTLISYWLSWANQSLKPKRHLDLSRFCRAYDHGRPTDHTAPSITIGGSYVRSTAMRPNNNMHLSALLCLRLSTWVRSVRHYDRRRSTTSSWQKHCVINPTSGYLRTETRRWFAETDSFRPTRTHGVE